MKQVAPGVMVPNGTRRILYEEDRSRADDLRAAAAEVVEVRRELANLRGRLEAVGRAETGKDGFWFDSTAYRVAGSLTLGIQALHELGNGDHRLEQRADAMDALWKDAEENPDDYLIKEARTHA